MENPPYSWLKRLEIRNKTIGNTICMGLDPLLERIPLQGNPSDQIKKFFLDILEEMVRQQVFPAVVKPNIAFFEALGLESLKVLQELIREYQSQGMLVLLDAKRGDIGKTSKAYADMAFQVYGADAVTVSPYMGFDSVKPFQQPQADKGIYILCRTSNPSAVDFQSKIIENSGGDSLYKTVAKAISNWTNSDLGAVVGATAPSELQELLSYWDNQPIPVSCLIPGVSLGNTEGGQGGDPKEIYKILKQSRYPYIHLVNSSSGILYAYENHKSKNFSQAAVEVLQEFIALS